MVRAFPGQREAYAFGLLGLILMLNPLRGIGQTLVWQENFNGYASQTTQVAGVWSTDATDMDDSSLNSGNFWGTDNGAFRCNDVEGPFFSCQNYFTTSSFDISSYGQVSVEADFWFAGNLECPGDNQSDDIIQFQYRVDNGPWQFFDVNGYVCGSLSGTNTAESFCIQGDSIALRIMVGNKANSENTYFDNVQIFGYNPPLVQLPDTAIGCGEDSAWLVATGGTNYHWYSNGNLLCQDCDSILFLPNPGGSWVIVEAIDSANCPVTDSAFVAQAAVTASFLPDQFSTCAGEELSVPSDIAQSFLWSTGDTTNTTEVFNNGLVWLEIVDSSGCILRDTTQLTVRPVPDIELGPDSAICSSGGAPVFLSVPNTYDAYLWHMDGVLIDTGTSVISVTETGVYSLMAEDDGCIAFDTVSYVIGGGFSMTLGSDRLICDSGAVSEVLIPNANPSAGLQYLWQDGSTANTLTVTQAGVYAVQAYNDCDTVSDSVRVELSSLPQPFLQPMVRLCEEDTALLVPLATTSDAYNYQWSDGSTERLLEASSTGLYGVTVTSDCGVGEASTEVFVQDWPEEMLEDQQFPCFGFEAELSSGVWAPDSIRWSTGSTDSLIYVTDTGLYHVDVRVCDSLFRSEVRVSVTTDLADLEKQVYPNVITPNGDLVNDELQLLIDPTPISDFEVRIYNRWGNKVFESTNPFATWDGGNDGDRDVKMGVYYLQTSFYHECLGKEVESTGSVTVIR